MLWAIIAPSSRNFILCDGLFSILESLNIMASLFCMPAFKQSLFLWPHELRTRTDQLVAGRYNGRVGAKHPYLAYE